MARTAEMGWEHDGIDLRLVLDPVGDGDVEILDIIEEGTEVHRPDLLDLATAALPGMREKIGRALDQFDPGDYDDGDRAYDAWKDAQMHGGRP